MAEKKMTQAQRSVEQSGGRSRPKKTELREAPEKPRKNTRSDSESAGKKKKKDLPAEPVREEPESNLYTRWILAGVYLVLFLVFLVIAIQQEGWILSIVKGTIFGLFGPVAFYLAIPAMLYLFILHAFYGDQPTTLRSCCTLASVFCAGCISHITMKYQMQFHLSLVKDLWISGVSGSSGGVLCGLIAGLLEKGLGKVLTLILLTLAAMICLLAAFRITIPSLIQAFQDRPRFEEDEEESPVRPEPASVLVNSVAVKQHEMKQKRQQKKLQQAQEPRDEAPFFQPPWRKPAPQAAPAEQDARGREILRQIADALPDEEPAPVHVVEEPTAPVIPDQPVIPVTPVIPAVPETPEDEEPEQTVIGIPIQAPAESANRKVTSEEAAASAQEVTQEIQENLDSAAEKPVYTFPSIDLLQLPSGGIADGTAEMRENTRRLNEALNSFKVDAHVTNVTRGPSVTRYEVELMQGVRLSKLTSVADDIALSLGTSGVRIAPVPNKISVVGIEVPNQAVTTVTLREVVDSEAFRHARSCASFAVGKDISGTCIVGNITKLPHMLIAGTTGSGKSVCMNSIILSLLYKASPEDVRLIMIDPKMVELGIYNGIPHLLIPVVTDPKKAAGSLQWAVTEMMRRYRMMSEAGVRDLESYNELIDSGNLEGEHMAQVVVIIDELADLMLVAAKEVEESICRIAQMGRASGIHLIIATQRPSADVITGLMKANIPSRIAFAVASAMESRIILDNSGAEKLVGRGDMLYAPIGCGKPIRVQGCFVSDGEVEAVATYVKTHFDNTYDEKVLQEIEQNAAKTSSPKSGSGMEVEASADEQAYDEMLIPAVDAVLQAQQASVSMLQRKLKLGFSRAARIVDTMEELGIVGEHCGSKPRQILVTPDQWAQMKIALTGGEVPRPPQEEQMTVEPDEPVPDLID